MKRHYEIVPRQELGREAWDALTDVSDEAWLWHRYDFQDALATWAGSADHSFAVVDNAIGGRVIALVPLRIVTRRITGLLSIYMMDSLGAVACHNDLQPGQRRTALTTVREALTTRARDGRCLEARLSCTPMAPAHRGERCPRVNPLLHMGCENTLSQTWVVDLRAGREGVWAAMEGRARTAVRKAERAGVRIRPTAADDLDIYYRLHVETYRRTGVEPHPRAYFQAIWDTLLPAGLVRIWIAEIDGEPVAAENFGVYKGAALYWTGASSARGLEAEAGSLLQWTAMQWMADAGLAWYETGEGFPQAMAGKSRGLNDFKKSFGGQLYPYYKGRLPLGKWYARLYRVRGALAC
jgi:CelD/BcsL family acetyltransferase involved in cellulose biosynthesis